MLVIGLSGKARSGKDTAAKHLANTLRTYGYTVVIKSLADPLKDSYCDAAGITRAQLDADKETHRPGLQQLGQQMRMTDELYWINKLFASIKASEDIIIIPDVRYKNEYGAIKEKSGMMLRVERDRDRRIQHGEFKNEFHISEVDLDSYKIEAWDKLIYNNGSQDALYDSVNAFSQQIAPRLREWVL